jgi:hypothetical protein
VESPCELASEQEQEFVSSFTGKPHFPLFATVKRYFDKRLRCESHENRASFRITKVEVITLVSLRYLQSRTRQLSMGSLVDIFQFIFNLREERLPLLCEERYLIFTLNFLPKEALSAENFPRKNFN